MKKYFTPLGIIFALEILVVFLAALGIAPREIILFWTGLAVFFVIFSPPKESLWLILASIPLFAALPVFDSFDTMANWRLLMLILFFKVFWNKETLVEAKNYLKNWRRPEILFLIIFFLLAALSIFIASFKILAIKKLIFIVNAFFLFLIVKRLARDEKSVLEIWRALAAGGGIVILAALIQFLAVIFVPLFNFWQFWAIKVISAFYGENLAHLLSYSNTWFAYYSSAPPTLRLFSVFPDSHSFAMFNLLIIPVFLSLALFFKDKKRKRIFFWILTALALFSVAFSGSRGAWLNVAPALSAILFILRRKIEYFLTAKAAWTLILFIVLFVFSAAWPPVFYQFQAWQKGEGFSGKFSFFERAKSISDADEISNKGRLQIWQASFDSVKKNPILGVGLGNYVEVLDENVSAAKKGASAHNLYLDFACEIGLFGAAALIAIFALILKRAWLVFRHSREEYFKFFGLVFLIYFFWILGYSFFDVVLLNDKVLLLFMAVLGILYSLKISKKAES